MREFYIPDTKPRKRHRVSGQTYGAKSVHPRKDDKAIITRDNCKALFLFAAVIGGLLGWAIGVCFIW